ncbi:MAG: helix-turn-helix domain-containing protein [Nostoc sp.]|uniref:helix-turn-helix domain-containing protein n=1 Tax=Nostoc sp. TaxID=1180 RepID=UPI002FF2DD0A
MPISYSKDLRERVIMAYVAKEGSQRQLAQRFKVSLSFVRNLLRQYRTNALSRGETTWRIPKANNNQRTSIVYPVFG